MLRQFIVLAAIVGTGHACARPSRTAATSSITSTHPAGTLVAGATVTNMPRGDVKQFTVVVAAVDSGGRCRPVPNGVTTDGERMLLYRFDADGSTVRNIALHLDRAGRVIRYSDIRGDLRMKPSGASEAATSWGPQTSLTMDGRTGTSVLRNSQRVDSDEIMMVTANEMLNAPNLGTPRYMIEHIRRVCGNS